MKGKKRLRDMMYENIQAEYNEEVKQGDLLKEISESQKRQTNYANEAFLYGANYYTDKKLEQLTEEAEKYLFQHLDINDIKIKITNVDKPNIGMLEKLFHLEEKIAVIKEMRENEYDSVTINKNSITCESSIDFEENINGGGNDEN